jgi:hypothetical protein
MAVRFAECGGGDGERGCGDTDPFTTYVAFRSGTDEITERLKQPFSPTETRYQTTKHRANRNTLPDNQTQSQQKYVTR